VRGKTACAHVASEAGQLIEQGEDAYPGGATGSLEEIDRSQRRA